MTARAKFSFEPTAPELIGLLRLFPLPVTVEKMTQVAIGQVLESAGVGFRREVRLSSEDVIDFLAGNVGIEVKLKAPRRAVFRQLERYAAHDEIGSLLLITNVPMGLPQQILGKPAFYLHLARAWL